MLNTGVFNVKNYRTVKSLKQFSGTRPDLQLVIDLWNAQDADFYCLSFKRGERWWDQFISHFDDIGDVISDHAGADVYFCCHGFRKPQRRAQYALPSNLLWSDLDEIDPRDLDVEPTIAWRTSRGRYQAIWRVDDEPTQGLRRGFNLSLGRGIDPGFHLAKVLRLPGTLNYKYNPPQRVKLLWSDGPEYRLRNLRKYEVEDHGGGNGAAPVKITLLAAQRIARKFRGKFDSDLLETARQGDRSDIIWKLGCELKAAGANADEIATMLYASAAWQSKHRHASMSVLRGEVRRVLAKGVAR